MLGEIVLYCWPREATNPNGRLIETPAIVIGTGRAGGEGVPTQPGELCLGVFGLIYVSKFAKQSISGEPEPGRWRPRP